MAYTHSERLSAVDATFLDIEDENAHMHVGAVAVFDSTLLQGPEGGVDIDRIRETVESSLHLTPRYRQRLAWIPLVDHPVWVDDLRFDLHYHIRHVCLPSPGSERQLKRFAGHAMAQPLDRNKPLWELWVVEGLENGRFAIITKTHHCMIDGVGSVDMMATTMRTEPDSSPQTPVRWTPRPAPSGAQLLQAEMLRRLRRGFGGLGSLQRAAAQPARTWNTLREAAEGVAEAVAAGLRPASPTPLNPEIGPHRRFDWTRYELADVKEVGRRLGGTVNDVVLANVTGALRRFLRQRGEAIAELDFRAMLPVNIRTESEAHTLGNRVAMVVARLPLEESEPRRRLERVIELTRALKASKQAHGIETLEEISDWILTPLFTQFARFSANSRPYNLVVTNVPGPQLQVYLRGAPLEAVYPLVPLYKNQALGVALFSYDGSLFWGFNADWDSLPDLHDLVEALTIDFEALRKATGSGPVSKETADGD